MPTSKNPFAEPDDDARTVILPSAPLRAALAPEGPAAASATQPPSVAATTFADLPPVGTFPLVAAAAAVLSLIGRLSNILSTPDPGALREGAVAAMQRYERALRDLRLPMDQIRAAHYVLCAALDDVVQNTPWGSQGPWADASLVSTFHREVRSGDRFFELLGRLRDGIGQFLPVVELMYLCMALGMQGRYRLSPRGPAELDRVREETFLVIMRQRGSAERSLSPHWRGVSRPFRPLRGEFPVWLAALAGVACLCALYAVFSLTLNAWSDRLFAAAASLPPDTMPIISRPAPPAPLPPSPQAPGARDVLSAALRPDVGNGTVKIVGTDAVPIIRIQSTGMFASGSSMVESGFIPVLHRIAGVLKQRNDAPRVIGYTDDRPIHTLAFPSNFQLSTARARAAAAILGQDLDPGRIVAEGRADADAVASNDTEDGRRFNRRIEIVLDAPATTAGGTGRAGTP